MIINEYIINKERNLIFNTKDISFYKLSDDKINELIINRYIDEYKTNEIKTNKYYNLKNIETIKLLISNDCNLYCKYCYANKGNYGKDKSLMSLEKANQIALFIKNNLPNFNQMLFFGGEPFMNIDVLEFFCNYFKKDIDFLVQTNGTIYNEKIKKIIEKHNITMTVSLDCEKEIHDENRIFFDGSGSYDLIDRNIFLFNSDRQNVKYLQATLSGENASKKEIFLLKNNMIKRYGISNIVISKDINETDLYNFEYKKEEVNRKVSVFFEDIINGKNNHIVPIKEILNCVFSGEANENLCSAGFSQLTIDVNGDIYPCPMYVKEEYLIGNTLDKEAELSYNMNIIEKRLMNKSTIACKNCVANFWCQICTAILNNDNNKHISDSSLCEYYRELSETVILKLTELISSGKINEFSENYKKI